LETGGRCCNARPCERVDKQAPLHSIRVIPPSLVPRLKVQLVLARHSLADLAIALDAILQLAIAGRETSQDLEMTGRGVVFRQPPLEKHRIADIESMSGLFHIHHSHGLLRATAMGRLPFMFPGV
jgi:hypothetical protein